MSRLRTDQSRICQNDVRTVPGESQAWIGGNPENQKQVQTTSVYPSRQTSTRRSGQDSAYGGIGGAVRVMFPKPKDIYHEPVPVRVYAGGRECCNMLTAAGKREYRRRVGVMLERQEGRCCLCYKPLSLEAATFEHEAGRGMGGGIRDDRTEWPDGTWINGAACWECNSAKGSKKIRYNS